MSSATSTGYELWDTQSRNLLEDFDTEAEALAAARELIELNPASYPDALALCRVDGPGRLVTLAKGAELAARIRAAAAERERRPA
jgi:hypothetical protein